MTTRNILCLFKTESHRGRILMNESLAGQPEERKGKGMRGCGGSLF